MKKLATIFLISATFLQPLQNFWVRISFELNRSYIAKNLCENRAKPELKCGGKCYLMKKLAEKQKQQEQQNSERAEIFLTMPFSQALPEFTFNPYFSLLQKPTYFSVFSFTLQECVLSTFRPPCAS